MRVESRFPAGTATNACFISGRGTLADGERIINTEVDAETLPPFGWLCMTQGQVQLMVNMLGWELGDPDETRKLRARVTKLSAENKVLKRALAGIVEAANEVGIGHLLADPDELVNA